MYKLLTTKAQRHKEKQCKFIPSVTYPSSQEHTMIDFTLCLRAFVVHFVLVAVDHG